MATTFLGAYHHTVDDKLRVSIPSKFRELIAASGDATLFAVARSEYISVFPNDSWDQVVKRLLAEERTPELADSYDSLRRQLALTGEICRLDSQGRIALRADQLKSAGIDKECVVFGNFGVIELWSEEGFKQKHENLEVQRTDTQWREVTRTV